MKFLRLIFLFLIFAGNICYAQYGTKINVEKNTTLTIFVHGIITIQPFVSLSNLIRFKIDRIKNTIYADAAEYIRKDPFFYQHHAMQPLGLQEINLNIVERGKAATAFARAFDRIAHAAGYAQEKNIYYTYGWSGYLSKTMRQLEAQFFYLSLVNLLNDYYKQGITPTVRIIGYSHGGCLALELANAQYKIATPAPIHIDELILVGTPILQSTITELANPIFKKVYNIYSEGDSVQGSDFFSAPRFFTHQTYRQTTCLPLPEKLVQINYKWYRLASCYEKKQAKNALRYKLGIRQLRPAHPGHIELWSFGWVPENYRQKLPYAPLPAAAYIPFIIQAAQEALCTNNHITVAIHSYKESIIVHGQETNSVYEKPFISSQEQKCLQNDALSYKPIQFTSQLFNQHTKNAIDKAREKKMNTCYAKRSIHRFRKSCFDNCCARISK